VPPTLAKDAPGKEFLYPVATVILGGLLSSPFLDIIVTPVVFWLVGEKALAQYFAAHQATGPDDHPQELDAQPLTPPADQDALSPVL
jgi:HME family heavy-metal exporter